MRTSRLIDPDADRIRDAVAHALRCRPGPDSHPDCAGFEFLQARGGGDDPDGLPDRIGAAKQGVVVAVGHLMPAGRGDGRVGPVALLAAWWTGLDGAKLVLIDACDVYLSGGQTPEAFAASIARLKPRDLIRGYRINAREGLVGALSRTPFAWLSRMPAIDPTVEALELAALYGDRAAADALHDYKAERAPA